MYRFLLIFLFAVNASSLNANLSEEEISELFEVAQLEELFRLRLETLPDVLRSNFQKIPGASTSLVEKSTALLKTKMAAAIVTDLDIQN